MLHPLQQKHLVLQVHRAYGLPLQPDGSEPDVHVELICGGPAAAARLTTSHVRCCCAPQWGSQQPHLIPGNAQQQGTVLVNLGCSPPAAQAGACIGVTPNSGSSSSSAAVWESFVLREDDLLVSGMVVGFRLMAERPAQGGWLSSSSEANIAQTELDLAGAESAILAGLHQGRTALLHLPLWPPDQLGKIPSNARKGVLQQQSLSSASKEWEGVTGGGQQASMESATHSTLMAPAGAAGVLVVSAWLQETWAHNPLLGACLAPDLQPCCCLPLTLMPPGSVQHSQIATAYCEPCMVMLRIRLIGVWGLAPAGSAASSSGRTRRASSSLFHQQTGAAGAGAAGQRGSGRVFGQREGQVRRTAMELGVKLQVQGDALLQHATQLWSRFRAGGVGNKQSSKGIESSTDKDRPVTAVPPTPASISHAASTVSTKDISRSPSGFSCMDRSDETAGPEPSLLLPELSNGINTRSPTPLVHHATAPVQKHLPAGQPASPAGSPAHSASSGGLSGCALVDQQGPAAQEAGSMAAALEQQPGQFNQDTRSTAQPSRSTAVRHVLVSNSGAAAATSQVSHVLNALEDAGFSTVTGDPGFDASYCWVKVSYEGQEHTSRMAHVAAPSQARTAHSGHNAIRRSCDESPCVPPSRQTTTQPAVGGLSEEPLAPTATAAATSQDVPVPHPSAPYATAAAVQQFGAPVSAAWAADEPPVLLAATRPLNTQQGTSAPQLELELWASKDSKSRGRSIAKLYTSLPRLLEAAGATAVDHTTPGMSRNAAGAAAETSASGDSRLGSMWKRWHDAPRAAARALENFGGVPPFMDPASWPQGDVLMQGKCENGSPVAVALYIEVVDADARAHALGLPLLDIPTPAPTTGPALRLAPDGMPLQQSWQEPSPRPVAQALLQDTLSNIDATTMQGPTTCSTSLSKQHEGTLATRADLPAERRPLHASTQDNTEAYSHPLHVSSMAELSAAGSDTLAGDVLVHSSSRDLPSPGRQNSSSDGMRKVSSSKGFVAQLRISRSSKGLLPDSPSTAAADDVTAQTAQSSRAQQAVTSSTQYEQAQQVQAAAVTPALALSTVQESVAASQLSDTVHPDDAQAEMLSSSILSDSFMMDAPVGSSSGGRLPGHCQPAVVEHVGMCVVAWCQQPPVLAACLPTSDPSHPRPQKGGVANSQATADSRHRRGLRRQTHKNGTRSKRLPFAKLGKQATNWLLGHAADSSNDADTRSTSFPPWFYGSQAVGHFDLVLHSVSLVPPSAAAPAAAASMQPSGSSNSNAAEAGNSGSMRPNDCFLIIKCGQHWVVTRPRAITPGSKPGVWGLAVRLPLIHPSHVVHITLLKAGSNDAAARKGVRSMMMGIHLQQGDSLMARLRLRASQLRPGVLHAAINLPLLGERGQSRGPAVVANALVSAMVTYPQLVPLLAVYVAPPVYGPLQMLQQGCVAGDDVRSPFLGHAALALSDELVERRRRRALLTWLGTSVQPVLHHRTARKLLEDGRHEFTLSRTAANWRRVQAALSCGEPLAAWWKQVQSWQRPWLSGFVALCIVLAAIWPSRACAIGTLWGAISLYKRRRAMGYACGAPPLMMEDSALEGSSITVPTLSPAMHGCNAVLDDNTMLLSPSQGKVGMGNQAPSTGWGTLPTSSSGYFDNPSSAAPSALLPHTDSDTSMLWLGSAAEPPSASATMPSSPRVGAAAAGGLPLSPVGSPPAAASISAALAQPTAGLALQPSALDAGFWGMPGNAGLGSSNPAGLHYSCPDRSYHGVGSESTAFGRAVSPAPSRLAQATSQSGPAAVAAAPPSPTSAATVPLDPLAALRAQYDNMVRFMLTVQNLMDGMASAVERVAALTAWSDPFATGLLLLMLLMSAMAMWVLGVPALIAFMLLFDMRPPLLRDPWPAPPANLLGYLPSRADHMG